MITSAAEIRTAAPPDVRQDHADARGLVGSALRAQRSGLRAQGSKKQGQKIHPPDLAALYVDFDGTASGIMFSRPDPWAQILAPRFLGPDSWGQGVWIQFANPCSSVCKITGQPKSGKLVSQRTLRRLGDCDDAYIRASF